MEDLKEKLLSSFIAFESTLNGQAKSPIHKVRTKALEVFEEKGFPTKRNEEWKYTNLKPILKHDYKLLSHPESDIEFKDVKRYFLHDTDTYKIVFVDGVFSSWLSRTTHDGYDICTFASAIEKYTHIVNKYFNKAASKEDSLTALNTAFAREGAFINIPSNTIVEKPIEILFFSTNSDSEMMTMPRNLVVVGENSQVQIIERHQSLHGNNVLTNIVTEIFAEERSHISYYKVQNDEYTASLIDNTYVDQKAKSHCTVDTFSLGGKFTRNNLNFNLAGEHCECHMDGITIIEDDQLVDHHTRIDHKVPNCQSNELYKGIYDDKAKGIFNGMVMVHPDAQKTNAFQQNNNILLTDTASIDTKPQLEIYADDVKCSHGCTVGQLDDDALFYMRSRGIAEKEAKAMLMYAFSHDALKNVRIASLRSKLNLVIAKKLGVDLDFGL